MKRQILLIALLALFPILFLLPLSLAQSPGRGQALGGADDDPLQQPLPPGVKLRAFIHRPPVVEPNHLGTCTVTQIDSGNFLLAGWHLGGPITWRLNPSTVPGNVGATAARDAIQAAFDTWSAADPQKVFVEGANTSVKAAKFDGIDAILWKNLGPWTIAVAYIWYYTATGEVAEADTVFNKRYPWAVFNSTADCEALPDAYDIQNIATHEFGHWIGLDDLYNDLDKDLTMYGFGAGGELKKRTLGPGDYNGANGVAP